MQGKDRNGPLGPSNRNAVTEEVNTLRKEKLLEIIGDAIIRAYDVDVQVSENTINFRDEDNKRFQIIVEEF